MTPEIRRAVPEDVERILELLLQVAEVHRKGRPDLFRENATKYVASELLDIIANEMTPIFVAVREGTVVGYVFCIISEVNNSTMLK